MYKLKEYLTLLEKFAPLCLSYKMIEKGAYDNSGIIVDNHDCVKKVLFSLDLSKAVVEEAKRLGCDTIITHHPAIYAPVKELSINGQTRALVEAVKLGLNVISMHLNLDVAKEGIDFALAKALGAKEQKILDLINEGEGYGREFLVDQTDFENFVGFIKSQLNTDKVIAYGKGVVNRVASFCGAGGSDAVKAVLDGNLSDTIITSDLAHHNLKELIELDKKVIIIPHYTAENYGFEKFYEYALNNLVEAQAYYFTDKRFM